MLTTQPVFEVAEAGSVVVVTGYVVVRGGSKQLINELRALSRVGPGKPVLENAVAVENILQADPAFDCVTRLNIY